MAHDEHTIEWLDSIQAVLSRNGQKIERNLSSLIENQLSLGRTRMQPKVDLLIVFVSHDIIGHHRHWDNLQYRL